MRTYTTMRNCTTSLLTIGAFLIVSLVATVVFAEQPSGYSGLDASHDAYVRQEERRRSAIGAQLDLVQRLNWYARTAPYYTGDVYYDSWTVTESTFALDPWHRGRRTDVESWPVAGRDLWGRSLLMGGVRQPVGQRQIQTGPNRWESHPIYAEPSVRPAAAPPKVITPPNEPRAF